MLPLCVRVRAPEDGHNDRRQDPQGSRIELGLQRGVEEGIGEDAMKWKRTAASVLRRVLLKIQVKMTATGTGCRSGRARTKPPRLPADIGASL